MDYGKLNLIKVWKRKRSIKRIEAFKEVPSLLKRMTIRQKELVEQIVSNPPFPPEEMRTKLDLVAVGMLKSCFPEIWTIVESEAVANNIPVESLAGEVFRKDILPVMKERLETAMEESLKDIEEYCSKGIDKELDNIRK